MQLFLFLINIYLYRNTDQQERERETQKIKENLVRYRQITSTALLDALLLRDRGLVASQTTQSYSDRLIDIEFLRRDEI